MAACHRLPLKVRIAFLNGALLDLDLAVVLSQAWRYVGTTPVDIRLHLGNNLLTAS